jgi:hypothetical protein
MNVGLLASILLAALVGWYLVAPHLAPEGRDSGGPEGEDLALTLADQKARCIQVLRDLELDFTTGKISNADYDQTKTRLSVELAAILERIDALNPR